MTAVRCFKVHSGSAAFDQENLASHIHAHFCQRLYVFFGIEDLSNIAAPGSLLPLVKPFPVQHIAEFLRTRHEEIHEGKRSFQYGLPVRPSRFRTRVNCGHIQGNRRSGTFYFLQKFHKFLAVVLIHGSH